MIRTENPTDGEDNTLINNGKLNTTESNVKVLSEETQKSSSRTWNFTDMFPSDFITEATVFDQKFGMDASLARPGPCGSCNTRTRAQNAPKRASYNFFVNDGSTTASDKRSMDSGINLESGSVTSSAASSTTTPLAIITSEQHADPADIQTLLEMGYPVERHDVLEAYYKANQDVTQAANYLIEQ